MSSIGDLLQTSPETLLKELNQLRERERLLSQERELLERVLEMRVENGEISADWLNQTEKGLVPIGPLRDQIVRVMKMNPKRDQWLPKGVHKHLVASGNTKSSLANVRTTMGRMVADGELVRAKDAPWFSLSPVARSGRRKS